MLSRRDYPFLPKPKGPMTHAVIHEKSLYISGLTAMGTDAQAEDLTEQIREILSQLKKVLDYEGLTKSDLIKLTIFIKEIDKLGIIREELFSFYDSHYPACSLVEVSNLVHADLKIEIEAVAAIA
ncbi:2-iminobutanoate/2-iminopropanoate deaminase [Microbulbifer sp. NBRC 101763]|uniref:RidA family protein n=1 Tax=Microbulbifer TaxID=48073 RepID=UPI00037DF0E6|nr:MULTISPECIES: RidA family protein [Microbulbifer]WHI51564.1 RidA family protein [Microbulbifer sp. MLAF003]